MKTFAIIMGAGRCGSSSLVSFLNKKPDFNIYGENNSIILSILEQIYLLQDIKRYKGLSHKISNISNKHTRYIGTEWYNPEEKLISLKTKLINSIIEYFDNTEIYIGFKEIRWINKNLSSINILEKIYKVKYIFLTRKIQDQINSMKKVGWNGDLKSRIENTDKQILNFLNTKSTNQYIIKNISTDKNFQEEIYHFIVGQN